MVNDPNYSKYHIEALNGYHFYHLLYLIIQETAWDNNFLFMFVLIFDNEISYHTR